MTGINDHMKVSRHALFLLASFEGKPRLKARRCEGGRYELSYGCTTWPDGRAVGAADFCNEDQALQLFAFHLHRFEAIVEKYTTVALNQFQYDALVCLAYNIGEGQFKKSSPLRLMNEKKWGEAAEAFGFYVFATSAGPSLTQQKMAKHKGQWRINASGNAEWIGPNGEACDWFHGLLGLECRHYAEGLLSLGLAWEAPCDPDGLMLETERKWDAGQRRWEDTVMDRTPFAKVKAAALALPRLSLSDVPPAGNVPFDLDDYDRRVEAATKAAPEVEAKPAPAAPTKPVEAQKPVPGAATAAPASKPPPAPVPAPPKAAPPPPPRPPFEFQVPKGLPMPNIPPQAKPQEATRRFWGALLYYGGKIIMLFGVSTLPGKFAIAFGETWGAVARDPQLFGMAIDALCFSTGFVADHCGAYIRKWGERRATRPMVSGGEASHVTTVSAQVSTQTTSTQATTLTTVGAA